MTDSLETPAAAPVLSWREMAILGWTPAEAMAHRGTESQDKAKDKLRVARQKLRLEGWEFPYAGAGRGKGRPLPPGGVKRDAFVKEAADAQRKSNWLVRLPASAR